MRYLLFLLSIGLWAQNPAQILPTAANPNGNPCQSQQMYLYTPSGVIYSCQNGTLTAATGGGAGTVTSVVIAGTANKISVSGTCTITTTGTCTATIPDGVVLVGPALGTPLSGVLTNTTGLPLTTGVTGVLPTANIAVALANQTSINGLNITGSTGTLAVANSKTLTASNTLTLAGTDSTVMTFPTTSATIARTDAANTFTGTQTIGALVATTVNGNTFTTGTGVLTIAAAKTLTVSNTMTLAGTDSSTYTFPAASATIPRIVASGATALDFASTATGACATVITASATGTASTDSIMFNANASIKAVTGYVPASTGGFSVSAYPTTNTVNFEACNWTAGTVDPGSITVNWAVIR